MIDESSDFISADITSRVMDLPSVANVFGLIFVANEEEDEQAFDYFTPANAKFTVTFGKNDEPDEDDPVDKFSIKKRSNSD